MVHEPGPTCPACGHVYEAKVRKIDAVDGELVEVTEEVAERLKQDRKREVAQAQTLADLEKIAAQRGYSKQWAIHLMNARARKRNHGY
jgi:hypothetical protein